MFEEIISLENLFVAWSEFQKGKALRGDVLEFESRLEDEIFRLHEDLENGRYRHGGYFEFFVQDPKRRHIHKASVRDRVLHHAIVRILNPVFERAFIYDSWSCRKEKGTHAAVDRLQHLAWKISKNNSQLVWVLQLDIRKFFDSMDHEVLLTLLERRIYDAKLLALLKEIIESFNPGLPLGNITSQLFANVYMNPLDQFMKHDLKMKGYLRYADDFVFIHSDRNYLENLIPSIQEFLLHHLKLRLHEGKINMRKYRGGIDFLGYVSFPYHRVLRTRTKRRIFRKIEEKNLPSYLGVLEHCRSRGIQNAVFKKMKQEGLTLSVKRHYLNH